MRILSPWADYYDVAASSGVDKAITYLRLTEERPLPTNLKVPITRSNERYKEITYQTRLIGFCGVLYSVVEFHIRDHKAFCYSLEEADWFAKKFLSKKDMAAYNTGGSRYWRRRHFLPVRRHDLEKFFREAEQQRDLLSNEFFLDLEAPIFLIQHGKVLPGRVERCNGTWVRKLQLLINPCLKDMEFYRIKDPYTAFQEIQMFLGSQAHPEPRMLRTSDEDLARSKGFDERSFRMEKGEKPNRKRGK